MGFLRDKTRNWVIKSRKFTTLIRLRNLIKQKALCETVSQVRVETNKEDLQEWGELLLIQNGKVSGYGTEC